MSIVSGKAEVIIGKQRHGPIGTVQLQFEASVTRFSDLARDALHAGAARVTASDISRPRSARPRAAVPLSARAVLTVDLDRAARQLGAAQPGLGPGRNAPASSRPTPTAWGSAPIAKALTSEGCKTFFVASVGRGPHRARGAAGRHHLRARRPAARRRGALRRLRSAPVLSQPRRGARLGRLLPRARAAAWPPPSTSTPASNRLGMPEYEVEQLAAEPDLLAAFEPDAGDEPPGLRRSRPTSPCQRAPAPALRDAARQAAAGAGQPLQLRRHCSWGRRYHFDLVRPGIALYGGRAHEGKPNPMQTVVRLAARSCRCASVAPGATHRLRRHLQRVSAPRASPPSPCGYADGFLRALSVATGEAGPVGYIGDYPVPIVGRVSMDFITVDVTERAAGADAARRLGRGDGRPRHRRRPDRTGPAPSATSCSPGSARASIASTSERELRRHGQSRAQHRSLPELRGGGAALGRQMRRLRRVEHASSRRPTARRMPGSG